jgi:hypothetical protein
MMQQPIELSTKARMRRTLANGVGLSTKGVTTVPLEFTQPTILTLLKAHTLYTHNSLPSC